jgi:ectoine hydroxylase-related dioxygenase (phytanoyl-CoA dioxygenase family)
MTDALRPDTLPKQSLQLSETEQRTQTLSRETHELAALILSCRGYVILEDALPRDFITRIGREVADIVDDCRTTQNDATGTTATALHQVTRSSRKNAAFWFRESRWRIFPWLVPPMNDALLLANPFAVPILEGLLGDDFKCVYVSSDNNVHGSILQSPHSDIDGEGIFVDDRWRPRGYIVNIPTMECGLHNGPLEVWPGGSHMWTADLMKKHGLSPDIQDGRNPAVERAAEYFPSVKVALKPGQLLIRDLAMWHRGTPNPTQTPRTMLTIAYFKGAHRYLYGDLSYNVDRTLYGAMSPPVKKVFAHHFSAKSTLKRKGKQLRSAVKGQAKGLLKKVL